MLTETDAKCLDGSPGAHYLFKGDPTKIIIFFEGGGWCGSADLSSTLESCYQRSKTTLGSSTTYPPTMTHSSGVLSGAEDNYFKNWTKVYMKYCDGSGHQGTRSDPIAYKDTKLFFRGQNVTMANFNAIDKLYGMFSGKVTHLVLTGCSAGGLATYLWANYLSENIRSSTKYWVIPDSGMFLDDQNVVTNKNSYRISLQNVMKYANE